MAQSGVRSVCVFCGAAAGTDRAFAEAAADLGTRIADADMRLVFGGGSKGLMGAVSRAALAAGGHVTGIIPGFLHEQELANEELGELHVVPGMHERKRMMFDMSDAFVALPGGIGTLDETLEMITWRQLGRHDKPIILVNIRDYWAPFQTVFDSIVGKGFAHGRLDSLFHLADSPQAVIDLLAARH